MGGDRVGEVSGRGAGDRVEAQLLRLRDGDRDDPVLERVRRVGGVVLDPQLGVEPELLGEPVGPDQRRQAGLQRVTRTADERQEVGVAPDPLRPGLDPPLRLGGVECPSGRRRRRAGRSSWNTRSGRRGRTRRRTPCTSGSRLTSDRPSVRHKKTSAFCGAEVLIGHPPHLPGLLRGLLDLAPPLEPWSEVVAGASMGQSLHPSGCGVYVCAEEYQGKFRPVRSRLGV